MLMAGAHLGALMIGLMVAFAATQLRPVFTTASDLREKSGLPVLGVVSMIVADDRPARSGEPGRTASSVVSVRWSCCSSRCTG